MDLTLNNKEVMLFAKEFQKELTRLHETHESRSYWSRMIMPKQKIAEIINHVNGKNLLPPGKERTWVERRKFQAYNLIQDQPEVLMEPTKEKLSVGANKVSSRYLQVVPREEIFNKLLKIHLDNNHSTLRETLHLVRGQISNIPRYLVHKFILLCPVCSNNGVTANSVGLPYTPSRRCAIKARRRRKLMDQFQVDVLDLSGNSDGGYSYILHCMDHITGFHWLFPLAKMDPSEVAQNLVWGIFSLFGFPSELVSDYGKDFASKVIEHVTLLWPDDLNIKNHLEGGTYKGDVTRRNTRNVTRFIDDMVQKKALLGDSRIKWSEWLPEIQFMLNATVLDVRTGKTPYEKVFRTQPITPVAKTNFSSKRKSSLIEPTESIAMHSDQYLTEEIVEHVHHENMDAGFVMEEVYSGLESKPDTTVKMIANGITFDTIETDPASNYVLADGTKILDANIGSETVLSSLSSAPANVPPHIASSSYTATPSADTEKWLTLSADGGGLKVAEIRPTIQQVKIAAGRNKGYRIDPVLRNAVYVNDEKNSKYNPSRRVNFDNIPKTSSSINNFRGFKTSFSPVKSNRVIHVSNIADDNDLDTHKISINDNSGYSNISMASELPAVVGLKRGSSVYGNLPAAKRLSGSVMRPQLKIPSSSNNNSGAAHASYMEHNTGSAHEDEYGVLSEDDAYDSEVIAYNDDDDDDTYFDEDDSNQTGDLIHQEDQVIHQEDQVIHQEDQVIHQEDQVIHQEDQIIHQEDQVVHQEDQVIHQEDQVIHQEDQHLYDFEALEEIVA